MLGSIGWLLADAAEEGKNVVLSMLVVGLIFIARDHPRRPHAPRGLEAQGRQAPPAVALGRPAVIARTRHGRLDQFLAAARLPGSTIIDSSVTRS